MKTSVSLMLALLLFGKGFSMGAESPASPLKAVHEWGTLTTVAGSDGYQFAWWKPRVNGPEEVPDFVRMSPFEGKSSSIFVARMETPVLYFYADKPTPVEVTVNFQGGKITEFFPSADFPEEHGVFNGGGSASPVKWKVDLLPPSSDEKEIIPAVGGHGAHYAHARAVPEAWLVRRALREDERKNLLEAKQPARDEVENFLFYRGAGSVSTPLMASRPSETELQFKYYPPGGQTHSGNSLPDSWILRVSGQRAAWKHLPPLVSKEPSDPSSPEQGETEVPVLPPVNSPSNLDAVAAELGGQFLPALTKAGLTEAEAKAMVATWSDTWFKEPGTRVLYLLPRDWVDNALPLGIKPAPQKMERVFVARLEVLSPSAEQTLVGVLDKSLEKDDVTAQVKRLKTLELGRFLGAGMERAKTVYLRQWDERVANIRHEMQKTEVTVK